MTAICTTKFRIQNAKDFLINFIEGSHNHVAGTLTTRLGLGSENEVDYPVASNTNHYLFIGRSIPWPTITSNGYITSDEVHPPKPLDTQYEILKTWDEMLALKRIEEINASLVIPRCNWEGNTTVYAQYDDRDPDLFYHPTQADVEASNGDYIPGPMTVITDEFHVFKCLSNNNGVKSTEKPLFTDSPPFISEGSDGYRWKYMYTVAQADMPKFVTDQWIPVKTLGAISDDGSNQWRVEEAAKAEGGDNIYSYIIRNAGIGYNRVFKGNLVSATLTTVTLPSSADGTTNNFYNGCVVWVDNNAPRVITAYDKDTKIATLEGVAWSVATPAPNAAIEVMPNLIVSGTGTGATARVVVETSVGDTQYTITKVIALEQGSGYTSASATISGGKAVGTGTDAVIDPALSPVGGHGSDAISELGGFFSMLNVQLKYDEPDDVDPDFPLFNDYRKVGLIRNVLKPNAVDLATDPTLLAQKTLNITNMSGGSFSSQDQSIHGPGSPGSRALGTVIDFIPNLNNPLAGKLIYVHDNSASAYPFTAGMHISNDLGVSADILTVKTEEVLRYSGDILYMEYRRPIMRSEDQIEDIKLIVEW